MHRCELCALGPNLFWRRKGLADLKRFLPSVVLTLLMLTQRSMSEAGRKSDMIYFSTYLLWCVEWPRGREMFVVFTCPLIFISVFNVQFVCMAMCTNSHTCAPYDANLHF